MIRGLAVIVVLLGCGHDPESDEDSGGGYDFRTPVAIKYRDTCQVCHGEVGEGGIGPSLVDTERSRSWIRDTIAKDMPKNNPGTCTGSCADELADFIVDGLTSKSLACKSVPPGPRRLRLLTRREYRATIHDIFGDGAPAMACSRATDCAYRDRCDGDTCRLSACTSQTFVFDPHGRSLSKVHVAGDFNGWAGTIAGGGLALARDANGLWTGTFTIGEGIHQYKFVLDEHEWVADPRAPQSTSDGFGGQNSAFTLSCGGGSDDVAGEVPAETRSAGFLFDSDADSAVVTAAHVDAYLASAEKIADFAATQPIDLAALGAKLFRRPLDGEESARYTALDRPTAIHAMLVSPAFLYRSEIGVEKDGAYHLTPYEIATALSYTFLGTTPSDALIAAATAGELDSADGIERWARALIADPRAREQFGEMALAWTGGEAVTTVDKRADLFPGFDAATRESLADETRAFAIDVAFDGSGRFEDLITANYTVIDQTAARFYGYPNTGVVEFTDERRAGVLGHAAMLATTAHSDQTSPIRRGLFVRRNLLCEDLPPPPPFAGGVPPVDPNASTRDRFAQHTANEVCAGCHKYIDGLGFGFEGFDPVGRTRTMDGRVAVDTTGVVTDVERLGDETSTSYATIAQLAGVIAESSASKSCFARQYLRFSRGLHESLADRCDRKRLEHEWNAAGHDLRELMVRAVLSPAFTERR